MKILALASTSIAALFAAGAAMAEPALLTPAEAWGAPPISNQSYVEQIGDIHVAVVDQLGATTATSLIIQGRDPQVGFSDDRSNANVDQRNSTGAASYVVQYQDRQEADVIQRGSNETAGIVQAGSDRNKATITQTGAGNSAAAGIPGLLDPNGGLRASADSAIAAVHSTVNDPVGTFAGLHGYNGTALILQVGNRNEGTITQGGDQNTAVIVSEGNRNEGTITQTGIHDDAFILQDGNYHDATITQSAYGDIAIVYQNGFNNGAVVNQSSSYAFSVTHQLGNNNNASVTQ